ncbi:HlyD family efflux transporter periplasmic adaptor subunit [Pelomonas sp. KK5]|uniref:HlyD family efflux transporter periplasmic adaptor subunit n=1 Tax=Pelomonas sp. KK5 TaxID=1855730 RepID=UPI00097BF4D6|nr:HlyD family efflux transporter periplasmic adaptor subunit [Pelomonas sp. KK5]
MDRTVEDLPLPPLRQDLRLLLGSGGGWKIHDPLAQRFFEVDQDSVDLLAAWQGVTLGSLTEMLARRGHEAPQEAVAALLQFLEANELLAPRPQMSFARARSHSRAKPTIWQRLLHGYLSIRIPLARPDRFLRRTLPYMAWAFSPVFWCVIAALAALGLYLLSHQWEAFLATFPRMVDMEGFLTYGACLIGVKALHELGHGYTAVRLGSRVSSMGITLLVMTPVAYTDTTDAWRLSSRADRVRIDVAGMAVEIIVAVFATLAWVFLTDGALRSAAFALATTGWVMSVAVNLNPLMRFDGYYLMSDLVGIPNLQERSFAMTRWQLREWLFGYGDEAPEAASAARRVGLQVYAWWVWIYRFFLFIGIALLVYHYFFKLLGIFLFGVEMWWFVMRPIWNELRVWFKRRGDGGTRARWTFAVAALVLVALCLPWPYTLRIPAVLSAAQQAPAFAPRGARVEQVLVATGQPVKQGEVLLRLSSPQLDDMLARSRETAAGLQERLARRASDLRDRAEGLVLAQQLRMEQDRMAGLQREQARLTVRAAVDGTVIDMAEELHPGRWVDDKTRLALVGHPQALEAHGYVEGTELGHVDEGSPGRFVDEARLQPALDVTVRRIGAAASEAIDQPLVTSVAGGALPVRNEGHVLRPDYAAFEIVAVATRRPDALPLTEVRGELQVRGHAQSLALHIAQRVVQILVRETVL